MVTQTPVEKTKPVERLSTKDNAPPFVSLNTVYEISCINAHLAFPILIDGVLNVIPIMPGKIEPLIEVFESGNFGSPIVITGPAYTRMYSSKLNEKIIGI